MDVDSWLPFFKIDNDNGTRCMAQQTYEPLINPERTVFCANYDWQNKYQHCDGPRPEYTEEVVDYFWQNELKHFEKFKNSSWCPAVLDIDYTKKRIFFEWNGETCNEIIYSGRNLVDYCPDWRRQISNIMLGIYYSGTYKLTMYPHCHFIDKHGVMKTIDMYGCVDVVNPTIPKFVMDGIIHETARFRLAETEQVGEFYNLENMFKRSMIEHVKWGTENMSFIYKEMFNA